MSAARGMVAFLGYHDIIGLSTFATNLLVTLAIAAATDYAIFLIGRYQEARAQGEDREDAYYTMFGGTAHVVLGSGSDHRRRDVLPALHQPALLPDPRHSAGHRHGGRRRRALTLGPAVISVAIAVRSCSNPSARMRIRGWRKIGALVVRWPGPILVATIALALVGLLTLPGYQTNYNDRNYLPADLPANAGYAAADRHFSQARMNPELLMIESDHDLRNSADFLVIDKIAKAIFRVPGHRSRAGHHPAGGHADRAHLDPVPDQHAGHQPADEPEVPAGPDGRHAQAGRRDADRPSTAWRRCRA